MPDAVSRSAPHAAALYLAVVQFLFATCWTLYVIYLPGLLESAGLPARHAPWILIIDQLTFMVMDVVTGVAADRTARRMGRIGPLILALTVVSCAAFLLIPYAGGSSVFLLAAILTWTVTSSALRAPPWVLLSRHAAVPSVPWMNALMLSGLAVGGAIAPYLGIRMKGVDPRLPFVVSSLVLLATVAGLIWIERRLVRNAPVPEVPMAPPPGHGAYAVAGGCLLLALGFQIHFSLNSAGQYLRLADAARLPYLMPVFWVGFNLAVFPGAALARRYGALSVTAAAALVGAAAALVGLLAQDLGALVAAQLTAGGAWGCILMAGFSAALERGRTGREGLAVGLVFAALATAALARIAAVATEVSKAPALTPYLEWAPFALWCAGGLVFLALAQAVAGRPATAA